MSENPIAPGELVPVGRQLSPDDMQQLAEDLVATAVTRGVQLTGREVC